jgi:predicted transcriptional regulator
MATNQAYLDIIKERKTKLLDLIKEGKYSLPELEKELRVGRQQILNDIKELKDSHIIVNTRVPSHDGTRHVYEYRGVKEEEELVNA